MSFLWPYFLLSLLLIPLLVAVYVWALRRKRRFAIRYPSLSIIRQAMPRRSRWRQHLPFALFLLGLAMLATALARGNNRRILEESLATVWGEGVTWHLQEGQNLEAEAATDSPPATDDPILKHPFVQTALDIFGGTARAIKSDDSKEIP